MVYFPQMTSEFPAQSDVFRRVLWTGESSQLVEMTIPVGGEIGEEVSELLVVQPAAFGLSEGEPLFSVFTGSSCRPAPHFHQGNM
jgi:hypothetical protein